MGTVGLAVIFLASQVRAAEPLLGRWLLVSQEVDGQKAEIDELTLRIISEGQALEFAYSVPVNNIQFVSLRFTARLDGTEADVTNANGKKIGTVTVTKSGAALYKILLQGEGRPTASGTMTVSADGKTLTSESDSKAGAQKTVTHMFQYFSRQ
jgi:hypothetical protein